MLSENPEPDDDDWDPEDAEPDPDERLDLTRELAYDDAAPSKSGEHDIQGDETST